MKNIKIFKNTIGQDKRGLIWTSWDKKFYPKKIFNRDKFSLSKKNVLRGLHNPFKILEINKLCIWKIFFCVLLILTKNLKII